MKSNNKQERKPPTGHHHLLNPRKTPKTHLLVNYSKQYFTRDLLPHFVSIIYTKPIIIKKLPVTPSAPIGGKGNGTTEALNCFNVLLCFLPMHTPPQPSHSPRHTHTTATGRTSAAQGRLSLRNNNYIICKVSPSIHPRVGSPGQALAPTPLLILYANIISLIFTLRRQV